MYSAEAHFLRVLPAYNSGTEVMLWLHTGVRFRVYGARSKITQCKGSINTLFRAPNFTKQCLYDYTWSGSKVYYWVIWKCIDPVLMTGRLQPKADICQALWHLRFLKDAGRQKGN